MYSILHRIMDLTNKDGKKFKSKRKNAKLETDKLCPQNSDEDKKLCSQGTDNTCGDGNGIGTEKKRIRRSREYEYLGRHEIGSSG
ncbi:hypothetical protein E5340_07860 [Ligilactobacillus murinus]|uniref:Uncharacterized protein n=1 Tax=Ligilactobacillus murinus TaxID=1622 RepID=A0A4S2EF67_9LACO|nr:hypothetical protein E5340_07860 [Ligilactobacillus murinus]